MSARGPQRALLPIWNLQERKMGYLISGLFGNVKNYNGANNLTLIHFGII